MQAQNARGFVCVDEGREYGWQIGWVHSCEQAFQQSAHTELYLQVLYRSWAVSVFSSAQKSTRVGWILIAVPTCQLRVSQLTYCNTSDTLHMGLNCTAYGTKLYYIWNKTVLYMELNCTVYLWNKTSSITEWHCTVYGTKLYCIMELNCTVHGTKLYYIMELNCTVYGTKLYCI